MRYQLRAVSSALALLCGTFAANAQETSEVETTNRWFVELSSPPTADGGRINTTRSEKAAFRKAAQSANLQFKERFAYDTLFNGFSIEIAPNDFGKLSRIAGVKALYPVVTENLTPFDPGSSVDLSTALGMTGADVAQNELGLTGAGVKVGVIDSGIDFDHPDFGGDGVPSDGINPDPDFGISGNSRVKYGYDFVGDAYTGGNTPVPDNNPDSCRDYNGATGSHGTHVAGIVGANGGAVGVAPEVTFGAYRVFGCNGSTSTDIMAAAMERALADGMDVINMSIGSSFQWPQYPSAVAATRLVNQGVSVVASIGNSGNGNTGGGWTAGAPGTGAKVIGVASFDNTFSHQPAIEVNSVKYGYNPGNANATLGVFPPGPPPPPTSGSFPLGRVGTKTSTNAGCNSPEFPTAPVIPAGSLNGKVALIRRGTCGFSIKAWNAQQAGAVGVVLYDNAPGSTNPAVGVFPPRGAIVVPTVMVTQASGNAIDDLLAIGPQNMSWTADTVDTPIATANLISSFSSWGLAADLSLKPDIGAPGGSIRSTYPIEYGSYASISGTSMASPHVAGAVALLLQAKPNTSSNAVRDILQNSANPHLWSGNPGLGILDATHRQGAGMLNIPGAVLSTTNVQPGKLSLGESEFGAVNRTLTVSNQGDSDETYDLAYEDAISSRGAYTFTGFFLPGSAVQFSQSGSPVTSITVPAGGSASFDVSIGADPTLPLLVQYGGYITLTPQGDGSAATIPVAGFSGNYQALQVLVPTANGFPWLTKTTNGTSFTNQPAGATYTLVGFDQPNILAHFDHQSRRVRFEIVGTDGKAWHRAFPDLEYFGMNSTATGAFAIAWDGTTVNGKKVTVVPDGTYRITMSVLKALGDESNLAHWETFTTPVITIDRP